MNRDLTHHACAHAPLRAVLRSTLLCTGASSGTGSNPVSCCSCHDASGFTPHLCLVCWCAAVLPAGHSHQQRCGRQPQRECAVRGALRNAGQQRELRRCQEPVRSQRGWPKGIFLQHLLECQGEPLECRRVAAARIGYARKACGWLPCLAPAADLTACGQAAAAALEAAGCAQMRSEIAWEAGELCFKLRCMHCSCLSLHAAHHQWFYYFRCLLQSASYQEFHGQHGRPHVLLSLSQSSSVAGLCLLPLHVLPCLQADVPFPMPRTMYGPRMTWIGANLARWTGINAT